MLERVSSGLRAVVSIDFSVDVADVALNRSHSENKFASDLSAASAPCDESQDFDLSRAEVGRSVWGRRERGRRRTPAHELVDGLQNRVRVLMRPAERCTFDEDEPRAWYPGCHLHAFAQRLAAIAAVQHKSRNLNLRKQI